MTDPAASVFSSFSSDLADIVAEQSLRSSRCIRTVRGPRASSGSPACRDGRRGVGRRRRGLDQACRRNDAAREHRGTRSHDRHRAAEVRRQGYCAGQAFAVVPDLGSLSVVVAAEHGIPTAALGAVSLVGDRWRSLRGGEIDARIELDVRLRHSHRGVSLSMPPAKRSAWRYRGCDAFLSFRRDDRPGRGKARNPRPDRAGLSRRRAAARQAGRWHRRDGDECRQDRAPRLLPGSGKAT